MNFLSCFNKFISFILIISIFNHHTVVYVAIPIAERVQTKEIGLFGSKKRPKKIGAPHHQKIIW